MGSGARGPLASTGELTTTHVQSGPRDLSDSGRIDETHPSATKLRSPSKRDCSSNENDASRPSDSVDVVDQVGELTEITGLNELDRQLDAIVVSNRADLIALQRHPMNLLNRLNPREVEE